MVKIEELATGTGLECRTGDNVTIKYRGSFPDGKEFDKGSFAFRLGAGEVISGFDMGVTGMKVGQKRRITVPPEMGYGARGAGNVIPPNSTLVFEIELVKIG